MNKFAMVFPGQGSQSIGMLAELGANYQIVKDTFTQASEVLNYDLWNLVQNGSEQELNQTNRTQPALLTSSVAIWRILQETAFNQPTLLAGHSLGEYSALVCAGVIDFQTAIELVEMRGRLMQESVAEGAGAMYAIIGLDDEIVTNACLQAANDQVVAPVNFNSVGQVVIAGDKDAAQRAALLCKEAGAKRVLELPVSVPSHCALMLPAAEKLASKLKTIKFSKPQISVINNVDVLMQTDPEKIKDALVRQLYSPVLWTDTVRLMHTQGISELIEVGAGKVLTGLTKRIEKSLGSVAINDITSLNALKNRVI